MSSDDRFASHHQRFSANHSITLPDAQPDPVFDRFTRLAARLVATPISILGFVGDDHIQVKSALGTSELIRPETIIPRGQCLCHHVIEQQRTISIPDTDSSDLARRCLLVARTGMRSFLGAPIRLAGGLTVGALSIGDVAPREWESGDIRALEDLATLIAEEIERRQPEASDDPDQFLLEQRRREKERLLDAIGEGVYAVDISGICHFINRAGANILGYEPAQLIGRQMHETVHHSYPDGTPMPRSECSIVNAMLAGDALTVSEHVLWRQDGAPVRVELTASPVTEDGSVTGTVVRFNDLSEQQIQQEQLRASEVRKSAMFEAALDCIITIDHEGRIVEFNAAAERTFGYSREYATDRVVADLIVPPEFREACKATLQNHLWSGRSSLLGERIERPAMRADGAIIQTEMTISRIDLPDQPFPIFTAYLRDITERKQAEHEIRLYKHMVDAVGQVVIANDNSPERRITYWNRAAEQILGWSADEVLGRGFYEIVPEPGFRADVETIGEQVRRGENWQGEFRMRHRDGTVIPALTTVAPILDDDGELLGVISAYTDLTGIKQTEQEIRLYKHIVDSVGESVVACDNDRRIFYANRAAEEVLGWSFDDVRGLDVRDVIPATRYRDQSSQLGRDVRETGESRTAEFVLRRTSGETFPALVTLSPIFEDGDNPVGTIGIYTDISELKETEDDLRFHKHALDAVGQAIIATDDDRNISYWNRAAEDLLGWSAGEVLGKYFYDVAPAESVIDDLRIIGDQLRAAQSWNGEFLLKHRDGFDVPVLSSIRPVIGEEGEVIGIIGAHSDLTEFKRTAAELQFHKHALDAVGQAVIANDLDSAVTYWNDAAEEMLGWKSEEVLGEIFHKIAPDESKLPHVHEIGALVRQGHSWSGEFLFRHRDGHLVPTLSSVRPVLDADGEMIGIIGAHSDLTEIKRTEDQLRFHKHATDHVGQALIANDLDRRITYWNRAAEQMLGWSEDEVLGKDFYAVAPADEMREEMPIIGARIRQGHAWAGEFRLKHRSGSTIPVLMNVAPVFDDDGEIVQIIGAYTDISEIKETEREILFYKHLTDAAGQALVANDLDRNISYWNKAAESVFGWEADEVLGEDFYRVAGSDAFIDEMPAIGARVRKGDAWSGEFTFKRKNGEEFPALINVSPVPDETGEIVQIIGAYTDISQMRQREDDIRFFKHVVDAIGEAVVATSLGGKITYVNSAAERMLGWNADELLGRSLIETIPDQSLRYDAEEIAAYVRTGKTWFSEFPLQRKDGSTFPALISLAPLINESGETTGVISVYSEISDLKRAEEENRFFKNVVDAVGQVVIANDLDRKISYWNKAAEEVLGWSAEEVVGIDAATIVPMPDFLPSIPDITRIVRSGGTWNGEFPLQHRDGAVVPALTSLKPILNETGDIIGVLGAHTDIRELKRTEADLRFHKHIVDAVGQAVVVSDADGRITYWNKAAEDIYGWTADEVLGSLVFHVLPVESDAERASGITEFVAAGNSWAGEAQVRTKDGTPFPAYFTVSPIRDAAGEIVGIIGVSHDISDQKDYERQIEFHKIMLDAVGQTIVTTDMNRTITYWSKGAEQALGWTAEDVVGRPIAEIAPAVNLKEEAASLHKMVREGYTWTGEFPIRRKDGSQFPAVVSLAPVNLADQGTVGVIGVYTDISDLKETEEELRLHKHMLDAVGQAVFATDERLRITYFNHAAEELYGYRAADALGRNFLDFLASSHQSVDHALSAIEVVSREGDWTGEIVALDSNDREVTSLVNISPILGTGDRQVGLIIAMADISERRRAEEALKESTEQIAEILETMGDGFISLERDWTIKYVNRQAEQITQRSREDLLGKDFWTEFPDPEDTPFYRRFVEAFETNQGVNVTAFDPFLDIWLEVHASPSRDQLSVFFRDVTERRQREVALREAEERYRTLIEQLPAMTYIARADDISSLTYLSPQIESMLGYTTEVWLDNPTFWIDLIHPDDAQRVMDEDARTLAEGKERFTMEYRLRAADGRYRWLRDTATLIYDLEGNPSYWQGLSYDISEQKQSERSVRESEQRFRSLFENHPDAVFSIDRSGHVLSANPAFETMTGFDLGDSGDLRFVRLVVEEDRERVHERFVETHKGKPQDFRAGVLDPSRNRIELNLTTIPISVDEEIVGVHVVAQDVTVHQELENQLAHQAFHDSLTGLPNRNLFQNRLSERLEIARRNDDRFAVLFFDLDDFKVINDSLGHSAGDDLLIEVAQRVQTCIRTNDLLARLGGDEFTLLLELVESDKDAVIIAERIAKVLDESFDIDGHEVFATTSVGIAIGDALTPSSDDILRNADLAMYEAKNSGKNRYAIFEPSMNSRAWLRLSLETEMRRGIPRDEFTVYYQPIIDLVTGDLEGVEALVRWNHPERGFLTPNEFISVAEQSGLILPLGRWIIREASAQLRDWQSLMPAGRHLRLSLNLSPRQYQHPRLIEELTRSLQSVDFDPRLITLEITESIAMDDSPETIETLERLKEVGVQLALDDFGTGFSALSYLRRFPIDIIKIDQSFVQGMGDDPEDNSIVRAVMAASLAMKLRVTAEGIETVEQLDTLRDLGCHLGQGYLFSHALTPDEMKRVLTDREHRWRAVISGNGQADQQDV